MADLLLKPGREKSLRRRHPWVFSGAIREVRGSPALGETVTVRAHDGRLLGAGAYSPQSQIAIRMWTWDETPVDEALFSQRIADAASLRAALSDRINSSAYRLVHAESDNLPGLIVDRYGDYLVLQSLSAGPERWKPKLVEALATRFAPKGIYERSDADVRGKEGLPPITGRLHGEAPPERVEIVEAGLRFWVDIRRGHKTGLYLDQRENRRLLREFAAGRSLLNCFAYTGGFTAAGLAGGAAHAVSIESAADAVALGVENLRLNGLAEDRSEWIEGDVFRTLRAFRDSGRHFDLIVLDPPKFARSIGQVEKACRGYKDINWLAFRLLNPGGVLFTFSCSGVVSADLFQKVVAGAALDAGADAQIIGRVGQAADHPVSLNFPESEYLKGLICRVPG